MVHLKLLGQPTSTYEFVKRMLLSRAEKANIKLVISEVQEWEKIIEAGVPAIPTIKVNDHLSFTLLQGEDVNDFINKVSESILKEENFGIMKKIVLPIDFSEASSNAFDYALELAQIVNGVIKVIHAYEYVAMDAASSIYINEKIDLDKGQEISDFIKDARRRWSGTKHEIPLIDHELRLGPVVDEVLAVCEAQSEALIVIGSSGRGDALKRWFGSTTTSLVKRCTRPVLVIPPKVKFEKIQRIAYAYDALAMDKSAIDYLARFARFFDAELHLVHVATEKPPVNSYDLLQLWKNNYPKTRLFLHEIEGDDIYTSLSDFVKEQEINMVAMTTRKHGFFENLFYESLARKMTVECEFPLMVLHHPQDS